MTSAGGGDAGPGAEGAPDVRSSPTAPRGVYWKLLAVSVAMLFWELTLIRWVGASVRIVSYYTNFILVAAIFGLGAGALLARFRVPLHRLLAPAIAGCALLTVFLSGFHLSSVGAEDLVLWSGRPPFLPTLEGAGASDPRPIPLWLLLGALYVSTAGVFLLFGQWIGALFRRCPPLPGYSVEVGGSLLGILLFALMSALGLAPPAWFAIGFLLLILALDRSAIDYAVAVVSAAAVLAVTAPSASEFVWSPYYKIRFAPLTEIRTPEGPVDFGEAVGHSLTVNTEYHQMVLDLGPDAPDHEFQRRWAELYDLPYSVYGDLPPGPVLVVGSGTGNDVSAALRNTTRDVYAVDIDPAILELGRDHHPERPYQSERVTVVTADARSFLHNTKEEFALVVFGFLDSHRLLSSFSSVRLDNFVYTTEALQEVKRVLAPGGALVLTFSVAREWLHERFVLMIDEVFDFRTQAFFQRSPYTYGVVYANRKGLVPPAVATRTPGSAADSIRTATDDWPFLYLKEPGIPPHYRVFIAIVLALGFLPLLTLPRGERGIRVPYFLLGAGFFLIETSNIVTLSILFGSTWWVNVLVFAGILALVLLGNLTAARLAAPRLRTLFALLGASIVLAYAMPTSALLSIDLRPLRDIAAVLVFLGPVYFASLIFATLIRKETKLYQAWGSNVLGAVVGGACEYLSLMLGFKFLLAVTLGFYAVAFLLLRRPGPASMLPSPSNAGGTS
ncbi:spermidine synthase [Candidatus Palauibacter sp.]|uniref:spermidine synthase n=1 Tax=Candidatus Palauibacter sp. TaxID=3101350 RepID=UPI003B012F64